MTDQVRTSLSDCQLSPEATCPSAATRVLLGGFSRQPRLSVLSCLHDWSIQ